MARIFLSYRREDSAGHTGRILDHLSSRFGSGRVFMDVEGIEPPINKIAQRRGSKAKSTRYGLPQCCIRSSFMFGCREE
jgi:hypothetical protein